MTEEIVHALILRNNKYLAVRGSKDWYWKLPGGRIENGETPEIALRRELKEEIGIREITDIKKIHEFSLQFKGRNFKFYSYLVSTSEEPAPKDIEEQLEIEWQPLEKMLDTNDQASSQQVLYQKLKEIGVGC